jgi:hypothetical protein
MHLPAAGLLLAAIRDPNPTVFFEAKMLYRTGARQLYCGRRVGRWFVVLFAAPCMHAGVSESAAHSLWACLESYDMPAPARSAGQTLSFPPSPACPSRLCLPPPSAVTCLLLSYP